MKRYYFIVLLLGFSMVIETNALDFQNDQPNNIRTYLSQSAKDITKNSLKEIQTIDDWNQVKVLRYQQLAEMLSLTDVPLDQERKAPPVKIIDTIQDDGFKIVKLYYESLPQLYVPANLYIPDNLEAPAPAVLYVCGHSRTQKAHYQTHPRKWAQLGFVCLIIETIQWGEVLGDHWVCYARGWFHCYSRGYNPGGVEVWNGIRGIDLLCARDDVDASKIGVTGISGGGSQSFYLGAIDKRIKATAPVCGGCTLEAQIGQHVLDGHCDCMMPINTYQIDFHDIGALIAPRPLLIGQADRDGLNPIESVREMSETIRSIYKLHNKENLYTFVETPGPHSYHEKSRTQIFSFFIKHLMGKTVSPDEVGDIDETPETLHSVDKLKVYVHGAPADDRTKTIQDSFQNMAVPPTITSQNDWAEYKQSVVTFLQEKTFGAFPNSPCDLDIHKEYRANDGSGRVRYSFIPEKGYRLKIDCQWKDTQSEKKPVLLVLRSPNENRWDSAGFSNGLHQDWNRAYFEARGIGETSWGPELQWHIRRAAAWTGRTIASMRVYDVLRCIEALREIPSVDPDQIAIAARDEMSVVAMYAALLDRRLHTVIVQNPPETQNTASAEDGRGEVIEMLNCLRITDLPQLAGILYPTKVRLIGKYSDTYQWAVNTLTAIDRPDSVKKIQSIRDWKP
jgi:cephalosporin-C deacetylase-like acetyl esterase